MRLFNTTYRCTSHPPEATWKMEPSSTCVCADNTMSGRNNREQKTVLRNNTGMTALSRKAAFLKES